VGIFPEGKIATTRELLPFHIGVALMAIKADVPVYPVYLDGTQRGREMIEAFARPARATVAFGPAVQFDRSSTARPALEEAMKIIRGSINILASSVPRCV
jgi:1-acyl-sn-glycerol-3-phosphate acyltransferase